jgi:hypothetical protein
MAPRLDPNYIPSNPGTTMYPPIDDGAKSQPGRTGVSPDAVLNRTESATTQRPLIRIPPQSSSPASSVPVQPPAPPNNPAFSPPLNGKTISEPGAAPRITPVPDPDHPSDNNRAPQLINPRDKTA